MKIFVSSYFGLYKLKPFQKQPFYDIIIRYYRTPETIETQNKNKEKRLMKPKTLNLQPVKKRAVNVLFNVMLTAILASYYVIPAFAAPPPGTTTAPYTVSYSAKLTDSSSNPITTTQTIRFSLWTDADFDAGDLIGTGDLNPAAVGYAGWFEEHTVTPDANGLFHVDLGSITTLPNVTSGTHVFLEVDVKPSASPKTAYEVLDPTGTTADTADRHTINSTFFTINSDTVDNRDVGISPGDIVALDVVGNFPVSTIPGGTDADTFVLDSDDSVSAPGAIQLQFGTTLGALIEYDLASAYFNINDDINVQGGIAANGNIDFSSASEFHMREVADEFVTNCTTLNELVLDTTEQKIYVCTATGSPGTWSSLTSSGSAYNQSIVIEPEYEDAVIYTDGSNNKGKLVSNFVDTDGGAGNANINFYNWTTRQSSLQDIDLILRVDLPDGFTGFQGTPVEITYRTADNNTANNKIDVGIEDTTGAAITLTGGSNLTSTTFATTGITFGGSPTFTAGEPITIKIKLSALNAGFADLGKISINYTGI